MMVFNVLNDLLWFINTKFRGIPAIVRENARPVIYQKFSGALIVFTVGHVYLVYNFFKEDISACSSALITCFIILQPYNKIGLLHIHVVFIVFRASNRTCGKKTLKTLFSHNSVCNKYKRQEKDAYLTGLYCLRLLQIVQNLRSCADSSLYTRNFLFFIFSAEPV